MSKPSALTVLSLVALSGCTSYELAPREPSTPVSLAANQASVCVLRPHRVAALAPAVVRDNGQLVGMTRGPSHFCYLVQPGRHAIVSTYGDDIDRKLGLAQDVTASLDAAGGQTYFLHHDVSGLITLAVRWVPSSAAPAMMADTDEVVLTSAPDDERLPEPGAVVAAAP